MHCLLVSGPRPQRPRRSVDPMRDKFGRVKKRVACRAWSAGLPCTGSPNLPRPAAWVRGRWAAGGLEPWPQVDPGIVRGARAATGL